MLSTQSPNQAWSARRRRPRWSLRQAALVCLLLLFVCSTAQSADVFRVQEDWELVLDQVSQSKQAPQFETLMCPYYQAGDIFSRVTWNYRELPEYVPGGFQIQTWGEDGLLLQREREAGVFSTAGETVTWTQELEIDGYETYFRVKNGRSTTWGNFGGEDARLRVVAAPSNLNGYRTSVSVNGSGITYGANRVILLRIKEVRYYDDHGVLIGIDRSPHVIHQRD